uniref:Uncharacterized protein n=1 Tax=Pseudomonas phage RVTF4 TaxID=3236931 RepID=A0AB39CCL7_9VIRU
MLAPKVSSKQLEEAYAKTNELEKALVQSSVEQRMLFFCEVQGEMNDFNVPKFERGATMSQAFRMGMDYGVEATLNAIEKRGLMIINDETPINVVMTDEGADLGNIADLWANYINS